MTMISQIGTGSIVGSGRYMLVEKVGLLGVRRPPQQALLPEGMPLMFLPGSVPHYEPIFSYDLIETAANELLLRDIGKQQVALRPASDLATILNKYKLSEAAGRGGYGEVWRAVRVDGKGGDFILKRVFIEISEEVRLSGLREIYFGTRLQGANNIARFVEYFESESWFHSGGPISRELWLVFVDEGLSLYNYLYVQPEGSAMLQPSPFWQRLRTDLAGPKVVKEIVRQLLQGISESHSRNITHRDIKPENIILDMRHPPFFSLRIADFGSAVDVPLTITTLYGSDGPSKAEETEGYQPPEVIFGEVPYAHERPFAYDLWSVGVTWLEMLFGTKHIFQLDARTRARINKDMEAETEEVKENAYLLHALVDMCIYLPDIGQQDETNHGAVSDRVCSAEHLQTVLMKLDPLRVGVTDSNALDLIMKLLQWRPADRISAEEALRHPYFS